MNSLVGHTSINAHPAPLTLKDLKAHDVDGELTSKVPSRLRASSSSCNLFCRSSSDRRKNIIFLLASLSCFLDWIIWLILSCLSRFILVNSASRLLTTFSCKILCMIRNIYQLIYALAWINAAYVNHLLCQRPRPVFSKPMAAQISTSSTKSKHISETIFVIAGYCDMPMYS